MNLRQLECFVAIAEEKNFSKAAARLYMSQPAATQQIQTLEAELGFALFTRSKRNVALTPAGECFYADIAKLLSELSRAVQRAQTKAAAPDTLTIYYHAVDGELFYPRILPRFRARFPKTSVRYLRTAPEESILAVLDGLADFCLARREWISPEDLPRVLLTPVIVDRECCLVPIRHRLALCPLLSYADLDGEMLLIYDMHPVMQNTCTLIAALAPRARIVPMQDRIDAENLVRAGDGICISSMVACPDDENWVKVPLKEGASFEICAMTQRNPSPCASSFTRMAVEALGPAPVDAAQTTMEDFLP